MEQQTHRSTPETNDKTPGDVPHDNITVNVGGNVQGPIIIGSGNAIGRARRNDGNRVVIVGEHLPFVNREDVIKFIFADQSPAYHLIDAPAGFGKTALLNRLKSFYEGEKWVCGLASVHDARSAAMLLDTLANQFELNIAEEPTGRDLALAILDQHGPEFSRGEKKGIVIFIDLEKMWAGSVLFVQKIFQEYIPGLADTLGAREFRKEQHNPLRVVVAGHYLTDNNLNFGAINPVKHQLRPFTYNYILETVREFLPRDLPHLDQLTAHLMYYTAGHPGCISKTLTLYKQENYPHPDTFFESNRHQILNDIIQPEINVLRQEIKPEMRKIFDELSVFRFVDISVLRSLLEKFPHPSIKDEYDLDNRLRSAYLMDPWAEGHFLRDSITRDLIFLRILSDNGEEIFAQDCRNAQLLCQRKLEDPATQLPDKWLMEYLYQALQQCVGRIQNIEKRQEVRQDFLESVVQEGFAAFAAHREARIYRWAIEKALNDDWQLEFTVNYFLREAGYIEKTSQSPYTLMCRKLLDLVQTAH